MQEKIAQWYQENGYTLLEEVAPEIDARFEAARVVCDRGMGGVIERTRRIGVTAVRQGEHSYYDETNRKEVPSSEIEAWRPLQTA